MTLITLGKRMLNWQVGTSSAVGKIGRYFATPGRYNDHLGDAAMASEIRRAKDELEAWRTKVNLHFLGDPIRQENELDELIGALEAFLLVRGLK